MNAGGIDARRLTPGRLIEFILVLAVVISFGSVVAWYARFHYLPQPFIFNTFDTFMDWFNTAYFANRPGAYDVWHSVYPPLSFVFLRVFSLPGCYANSLIARDCDWLGITSIVGFYLIDAVLAFVAFRKADRQTAIPRGIAFAIGFPLLFALERGNLILPTLTAFIIAYGGIVRSPLARWICVAMTINFKPYLLLPALGLAFQRRWRALEATGIATIGVYFVTLALVGSGTLFQLAGNTGEWVRFVGTQFWEQTYFSTSYAPLLLIEPSHFPILNYLSSRSAELITGLIPVVIVVSQLLTAVCLLGAWLQPGALSFQRLAILLIATHLVTQSPGGYALVFLLFLVFLEEWRRPGPILALIAAYVLSLSTDIVLANIVSVDNLSWLSGESVRGNFGLTVGQFLRPALVLLILWSLAFDSLALIVAAHRTSRPRFGLAPHDRRVPA